MPWPETDEPAPTAEAEDLSLATNEWMARELVKASRQGHTETQAEIRTMGQNVVGAIDGAASKGFKVVGAAFGLATLCIAIVAALVGISITLPDGTSIDPHKEAAVENATGSPSDGSSDLLDSPTPEHLPD